MIEVELQFASGSTHRPETAEKLIGAPDEDVLRATYPAQSELTVVLDGATAAARSGAAAAAVGVPIAVRSTTHPRVDARRFISRAGQARGSAWRYRGMHAPWRACLVGRRRGGTGPGTAR